MTNEENLERKVATTSSATRFAHETLEQWTNLTDKLPMELSLAQKRELVKKFSFAQWEELLSKAQVVRKREFARSVIKYMRTFVRDNMWFERHEPVWTLFYPSRELYYFWEKHLLENVKIVKATIRCYVRETRPGETEKPKELEQYLRPDGSRGIEVKTTHTYRKHFVATIVDDNGLDLTNIVTYCNKAGLTTRFLNAMTIEVQGRRYDFKARMAGQDTPIRDIAVAKYGPKRILDLKFHDEQILRELRGRLPGTLMRQCVRVSGEAPIDDYVCKVII